VTEASGPPEAVRQRAAWCVRCADNVKPAQRVTDVAVRPIKQRCRVHGEVLQPGADTPLPAGGVVIPWSEITPSDAVGIALPVANIEGPLVRSQAAGGFGAAPTVCPWPWEAQQLPGRGEMAECRHCGAVIFSGVPHPDARYEAGQRDVGEAHAIIDLWVAPQPERAD
jgi:hypothetical protein